MRHSPLAIAWVQVAPSQTSSVQASPSLAQAEFVRIGLVLQPIIGAQESKVHALPSSHVSGEPMQVPAWQTSAVVQGSPSSHHAADGAKRHGPLLPFLESGLHTSNVQGLLSSQVTGRPAQVPLDAQVSPWVHALPSEQVACAITDQLVWLAVGTHPKHCSPSCPAPALRHKPPI
jgi:hypothetical protein